MSNNGIYTNSDVSESQRTKKLRSMAQYGKNKKITLPNLPNLPNLPGLHGIDGKDGKDGKDGRDGLDGKDGRDGVAGPAGPAGRDGQNGLNGRDGAAGPQGPKGEPAFALTGYGYSYTGAPLVLPGSTDVQVPGIATQGAVFNYINGNSVNQTNMTTTINGGEIWAYELIADGIVADNFPVAVSLKIGGNVITSVLVPSKELVGFQEPGCAVIRGTSVANNKHTIPAGTNTFMLSSNVPCSLTDFMIIGHRIF